MTRTVLFEDLVLQKIDNRGKTPPLANSGYPLLEVNSLSRSRLYPDISKVSKFVDEQTYKNWFRQYLEKDDILFSTVGTVAESAIIPSETVFAVAQNILGFRFNNNVIHPKYALYLMRSPWFLNQITGRTIETVQKSIKWSDMRGIKIHLPELDAQKDIANVLWTIDEKIELNRKMSGMLEQMGQALFKKYFITDTDSEKWGKVQIGQKIRLRRGKSLQSRNMVDGKVPVVSGGLQPAGYHNESNTAPPVVTVSASGANAGFVALWEQPVWSADSSYIDKTITQDVYFYYLLMKANQDLIYGMQTGSGQPHIYPRHIELLEIPNAPNNRMEEFRLQVEPLFRKVHQNKVEIQILVDIRDSLLPRMISGKIITKV